MEYLIGAICGTVYLIIGNGMYILLEGDLKLHKSIAIFLWPILILMFIGWSFLSGIFNREF